MKPHWKDAPMTSETPFVTHCKSGGFRLVWAADWDQPYTVDRNVAKRETAAEVERACESAYGVTPQFHGIGF